MMTQLTWRRAFPASLAVCWMLAACRSAGTPPIRFAPPGTDVTTLRSQYALTDAERRALTPENLRQLTQAQVDQIYTRLASGPIPDGPFRGDLFFPRDKDHHARVGDLANPLPALGSVAAMQAEDLGRVLWKGKVFFRSQSILRNRIEDLAILKPLIPDAGTIPKLTFDGATTWLLFPAAVSCGDSRFDATRRSIVIDYTKGPQIEGYREVPDKLAGSEGLRIRDEVRIIRQGFYLGRAYFADKFGLNFTLLDPAIPPDTSSSGMPQARPELINEDCNGATTAR
jgi:hypothetical protein